MTATDLHATALALIAERRGLIAAGTAGPWQHLGDHLVWPSEQGPAANDPILGVSEAHEGCAALIVAAVNDYGPLLDLAEAVLLRHAPDDETPFWCLVDHGYDGEVWPCPDATAALRSLGLVTT